MYPLLSLDSDCIAVFSQSTPYIQASGLYTEVAADVIAQYPLSEKVVFCTVATHPGSSANAAPI